MRLNCLTIAVVLTSVLAIVYTKAEHLSTPSETVDKCNSQSEETIKKEITICGKTINWSEYDKTFASIDAASEFQQILGVKWHGTDSVGFQLICSSMLCEMEISGTAIANNSASAHRFDEDENGTFPVDEFVLKGEDSLITLKIESESKTKARLVYSPGVRDYECDPDNELILKTINLR
ncbi:hypothetical protein KDU71_01455 [Carboxylicivirga sediminis]|uniref:Uncharacterized protein n=1 Tax=Carboxylicivirga sediminis TaxID=2006564 RepID=A0A941F0B6_9BACT|nr:hypothetical protein [Carboxylicivirga sediminis]MBR8534212.1 hypothetical protein [Carboxylicivirga sediminis]